MTATTINIQLQKPHTEIQHQMITFPGSVVAFCGRRFGKTDGYIQRLFYWMQRTGGLYWWVGLSWRSASMKRAWRGASELARQVLRAIGVDERGHINRSTYEINIPGLGEIWFRTADNPASLAGEGIQGAVIDEFSLMQELVWTEYLEGTLLDHNGWAAFAGVPKGENWAANLWRSALSRNDWLQVHATSYDNPFIDNAALDEVKANTTEYLFNQEYLAQIVDDAGSVFRNVVGCVTATSQDEPIDSHQYVMGVDWGKHNDFTVLTLLDVTDDVPKMACIDRFNQIDYTLQVGRLKVLYDKFKPHTIIAERNSMGEPLIEQLQRDGLPVQPFTTTNATKGQAIEALALAFERNEVGILNDPVLVGELQAYEMERLPSGLLRYNAPSGMHDDTVMSLALAYQVVADGGSLLLW